MIVVDASIAYKWADEEDPNKEVADQILKAHLSKRLRNIAKKWGHAVTICLK